MYIKRCCRVRKRELEMWLWKCERIEIEEKWGKLIYILKIKLVRFSKTEPLELEYRTVPFEVRLPILIGLVRFDFFPFSVRFSVFQ